MLGSHCYLSFRGKFLGVLASGGNHGQNILFWEKIA